MRKNGDGAGPPQWTHRIDDLITDFSHDAHVSRLQVARALGFPKYLSASSLSSSETLYHRLCGAFAAWNLPNFVYAIVLPHHDYRLAGKFFNDAVKILLGYRVDVLSARAGLQETVDWGRIGVDLFNRGDFGVGVPYLERTWENLHAITKALSDKEMSTLQETLLLVGTSLVTLDGLLGETARTVPLLIEVQRLALDCIRSSAVGRKSREAAAAAIMQVGVGYRLLGTMAPSDIVGYSRMGYEVVHGLGIGGELLVMGLRDQARPLLSNAYRTPDRIIAQTSLADADAVLQQAQRLGTAALAENTERTGVLQISLLQTRLTQVQYMAATGRIEEARREWDDVLGTEWAAGLLTQNGPITLRQQMQITNMLLLGAQGRLSELGAQSQEFQANPANAAFKNRLKRVAELELYAVRGDVEQFRHALLQ